METFISSHVKVLYNKLQDTASTSQFTSGVEQNNADAKRNYFSSSRWNAAADILQTEVRLEQLSSYERQKRQYTKHKYWSKGGIELSRSKRERLSREDSVED